MDTPVLTVYRELADHYERLGQSSMRDRFLMLAADAALADGQPDEAERLRQRLLAGNRHHMLRPYSSYEEASRAADVQAYLDGLRSNYPVDQARDLLDSLRGGAEETPAPQPGSGPQPGAIPPTAPLLDVNARQPRGNQPQPFQPMQVDAAPQRSRPRSPPPPATVAPPPPPRPDPAPPARPTANVAETQPLREIPMEQPPPKKKEPPLARPVPPPRRPAKPAAAAAVPPAKPGGGWLNVALTVIVATLALAVGAFALARPFLPTEWMP